jgi:hypothetical protein
MPRRIQRLRTKGWRMPDGAIYVGRPTRWGNPFRVIKMKESGWGYRGLGNTCWSADDDSPWSKSDAAKYAVDAFRDMKVNWSTGQPARSIYNRDAEIVLAGHDLACWCPLDEPCHADVLLDIANRGAQ